MTAKIHTLSLKARIALVFSMLIGAAVLFAGPGVSDASAETNTIHVTGAGKGTVTGPGSFSCTKAGDAPQACSQHYIGLPFPKVYTATPKPGSLFQGWSGACTGTGTCTLNGDLTATATFKINLAWIIDDILPLFGYTVTIQGGGTGDGTVTGLAINCAVENGVAGGICAHTFPATGPRVYHAAPKYGHVFAGWTGACSGTDPDCLIPGTGTATAHFEPVPEATVDPGASTPNQGNQSGGGTAAHEVDAEIVDVWLKRSLRGKRLVKVEISAGEPVHVLLSLERRGRQLVGKSKQLKAGERVLTLVVPNGIAKGKAVLVAIFEDATAGFDVSRNLRLPRA